MIGIIGGTGPEGFGLAVRWTMAGEVVAIGSRHRERAVDAAERVAAVVPQASVWGEVNEVIAKDSTVMVVAVPCPAVETTVRPLAPHAAGKLVVSVVAALEWVDGRPKPVLTPAGSVAQQIEQLLPGSNVTSGFQTLSAEKLGDPSASFAEDTLICGDDREARRQVMGLARLIKGVRPVSGGRLAASFYPELVVGMLAGLNRIYKTQSGLRIVGIHPAE